MAALKQKRHRRKKERFSGPLPLEEYMLRKLSEIAEDNSAESYSALRHLAELRRWKTMTRHTILENEGKILFVAKMIHENIGKIIADGQAGILKRVCEFIGSLNGRHLNMLLSCLYEADMRETIARLASYPFMDRNPAVETFCAKAVEEGHLIDLSIFGTLMCCYISERGGPASLARTQDHKYVLLLFSAYHPKDAERVRSTESYLRYYYEDPLELKEVVLQTPYNKSARYIIDRLERPGLIRVSDIEIDSENPIIVCYSDSDDLVSNHLVPNRNSSLVMWYLDCRDTRGKEDEVTKYLGALLSKKGISEQQLMEIHDVWNFEITTN